MGVRKIFPHTPFIKLLTYKVEVLVKATCCA